MQMPRHVVTCALIALLSIGSAWAGEVEDALERARQANTKADFATAAAIYRRLADDGNPKGMMFLGLMHAAGRGVARNPALACDYYQRAADKNLSLAQHLLGDCFYNGDGRALDYSQSKAWYERAAETGDVKADCALGNQYIEARGVPRDLERGMALCRKGADAGDADAQADLASRYLGQSDPQAHAQAFDLLTKAAAQGHANAALDLGLMYWNGDSTAKDRALAAQHFLMAWKGRNSRAPFLLGQYYFTQAADLESRQIKQGPGVQAMYWFSIAYKVDPNPENRTQALKFAQNLHAIAPGLNDALNAWLKTSNEPPPLIE